MEIIKRFCITNRVKHLCSKGHLRTLKESKWTFFTWKSACSLPRLLIEAQESCSYFTVDSQSNICWASGQPERDWRPTVNSPTWSSVSWSSIKLTQRNSLFLLANSTEWLASHYHQISQAQNCRISLAGNDGTLPGARRSTRDHPRPWGHGEYLPSIQSTHSPSQRPVWSVPVGPNLWSWAGCWSLHASDKAGEGINTSTVMAGAGIAHVHLSNFKNLFNMFFPLLPEIWKPENTVLISLSGRNTRRD